MTEGDTRVGITCPPDHPVFSTVGAHLVERGHEVTFLDPERPIPRSDVEDLAAFVNKRTRPPSVRALVYAERAGVPTWNGATGVIACISRFTQLCVLRGVGFAVPEASTTKPDDDYVAKARYHWDMSPEVNGEGDLYETLLPADPVDHKYYLVDTGDGLEVAVVRATSKLYGEKEILGRGTPRPRHVDRIEALADRLGLRAVGVDLVRVGDDWVAVDLNPGPSFRGTMLTAALADSIEACLADEADG